MCLEQIKRKLVRVVKDRVMSRNNEIPKEWELVLMVNEARKERLWASTIVNEVKDWDLIDQAIYEQGVAERKLVHLIKKAKEEGVTADRDLLVYLALSEHNRI